LEGPSLAFASSELASRPRIPILGLEAGRNLSDHRDALRYGIDYRERDENFQKAGDRGNSRFQIHYFPLKKKRILPETGKSASLSCELIISHLTIQQNFNRHSRGKVKEFSFREVYQPECLIE
jgi:hypothetical protein